jgi:hypothetical protein
VGLASAVLCYIGPLGRPCLKERQISARISDIEISDYDRTFKAIDIARPDFEGLVALLKVSKPGLVTLRE